MFSFFFALGLTFSMSFLLCEQRKLCLSVVKEVFDVKWSMISCGGFRHEGRGPPYQFEVFMEMCSIVLFVGDVFGYIAVDEDGVVDAVRSYGPFLEQLLVCLEIMHLWCMRHPPVGGTPKDRKWISSGECPAVLNSVAPLLRLRMVQAMCPSLRDGSVLPDGFLTLPDFRLRALFLRCSKSVMALAEEGSVGQCEPLRFTQNIRCIEIYLICRRVKDTVDGGYSQQHHVAVCLSSMFDPVQLCEETTSSLGKVTGDEWVLYWQLESYSPLESLYEEVKGLVEARGVKVDGDTYVE
jgi:hypothetical protein